jgi:hypothetical protein
MFALGGYAAPFALMGVFYIIMMPIVFSALTKASADRAARSKSQISATSVNSPLGSKQPDPIELMGLLSQARFTLGMFC